MKIRKENADEISFRIFLETSERRSKIYQTFIDLQSHIRQK